MSSWDVTGANIEFEFDITNANYPSKALQLDTTHYIVAYQGTSNRGYVEIVNVDQSTYEVTHVTNFQYDAVKGAVPNLYKISSTKVLCVYNGTTSHGFAFVLTIDNSTWGVTAGAKFEFDSANFSGGTIEQIDSTHYLVTWRGTNLYAYSQILSVDTTTNTVTSGGALYTIASESSNTFSSFKVDANHVLVAHNDATGAGVARILEVNTSTWAVTSMSAPLALSNIASGFGKSAINKIDSTHYLLTYLNGSTLQVESVVLTVNTSTWSVTAGSVHTLSDTSVQMFTTGFSNIDSNHVLISGFDVYSNATVKVLEVNTSTWDVSEVGAGFNYGTSIATSSWASISDPINGTNNVLVTWQGDDNDGFARVLSVELPAVGGDPVVISASFMGRGKRSNRILGMKTRRFKRYGSSGTFTRM